MPHVPGRRSWPEGRPSQPASEGMKRPRICQCSLTNCSTAPLLCSLLVALNERRDLYWSSGRILDIV